ncbi:amino acid transporter heavy chain SLC3A2 isoform X1 [Entelurus aequoreus]|uniref:amino acid transporter heavy chain SLC3A2 isoform X1 n=1 Tax=Entelurus aequoreus TaxID=161455 RepID=UPI002B1D1F68|nr:amino acid transporter heavy chain SLC3A2 isoform X1 [Entelurus aequoreus]
MPLNAGDNGYGSVASPGLSASEAGSETASLLVPDLAPDQPWRPMSKEDLEVSAGSPGWRRVRCYLVLLFWLTWLAMLATAVAIIVTSPRPVPVRLSWWQKSLFFQLQPDLSTGQQSEAVCEQLPYFKSLGISGLILRGFFGPRSVSPVNVTETGERSGTLPQIQHLLSESDKAGLKVLLDVCDAQILDSRDEVTQHALRFWLEKGVAGILICDTDEAYSEETLLAWRSILKEFSQEEEEERIVVVKQTGDLLLPPGGSAQQQLNITLVDVVMRSVLPASPLPLSAREVAVAIERHLQTPEHTWLGWQVGGKAPHDLRNLLLVLMMTLPGTPAVQYQELDPVQSVSPHDGSLQGANKSETAFKAKPRRSTAALLSSLSHIRAREEALLFGSFTFLPFNASSSSSNATLSPALAFLRSWGCVHFLVLINIGPERHALDPAWAPSLPEAGVFVSSTEKERLGAVTLKTLVLQPREAVVIKLFEPGKYS